MTLKYLLAATLALAPVLALSAEVVKVKGDTEIVSKDGKSVRAAKVGDRANEGDTIRTLANGSVLLKQEGGRYSALGGNGKLTVREADTIEQVRGAVYYVFRKLSSGGYNASYKVQTPIATIGIRGTRFLVKTEGASGDVAVTEGIVSMTATAGGSFSIEKLPESMTFDEYLQSQEKLFRGFQTDEFMAWKKRELESFALFKQQFFVTTNQSVNVAGSKVRYQPISSDDSKLIEEMDALVREQEQLDAGKQPLR